MKKQANRKAIVISAALTMMLLTFVGGKRLLQSESLRSLSRRRRRTSPSRPYLQRQLKRPAYRQQTRRRPIRANDQIIAAYQAQLEQAYQALDEAYAQIDTLQAAQAQAPSTVLLRRGRTRRALARGTIPAVTGISS